MDVKFIMRAWEGYAASVRRRGCFFGLSVCVQKRGHLLGGESSFLVKPTVVFKSQFHAPLVSYRLTETILAQLRQIIEAGSASHLIEVGISVGGTVLLIDRFRQHQKNVCEPQHRPIIVRPPLNSMRMIVFIYKRDGHKIAFGIRVTLFKSDCFALIIGFKLIDNAFGGNIPSPRPTSRETRYRAFRISWRKNINETAPLAQTVAALILNFE